MLNMDRFQEMVGISDQALQEMRQAHVQFLTFAPEFVHALKAWFKAHHITPSFSDLDQALADLFQASITTDLEYFYETITKVALKWHRSGLNQTEVIMVLSQLRQFLIKKSEQLNSRELAHGYCHLVDMMTSVFNTLYQLMEERAKIQQTIQGELKRFERSFHLLGLEMPKALVKPYVDHQMWKVAVLELAIGLKSAEQIAFEADETQCQLGKWIESGGLEKIPKNQQQSFLEDHRRVHEYGRQALKDAQAHHPEHILSYFNQIECASDRLSLVLLNLIEDEFVRLATSDHLTGLPNRRAFDLEFKRTLAFAERHQMWVGLLILDIDHFKQINDTYGHTVGDEVLQQLSHILQTQARIEEAPFRWGGEEFAVLTMDKKPGGAEKLAQRIRHAVETADFQVDDQLTLKVTVSVGSLFFKPPLDMPTHEIFAKVDKLLYQAKESGRNRVVHETIQHAKEV